MGAIRFKTALYAIGSWTILRLPAEASAKLSSRGQVLVKGSLGGVDFRTPLEPDGRLSHWFRVEDDLLQAAGARVGDTIAVAIEPIKEWPEPEVPADWQQALAADAQARELWQHITPMAHWEWIRWSRATNKAETRAKRIAVGISKLKSGERRPCCWNRNLCTEPAVSKSGVLLEPTQPAQ